MRLPQRIWGSIFLIFIMIAVYIWSRSPLTRIRGSSLVLRNNEIQITILGEDNGSRRAKTKKKEGQDGMTCNIPKLEMNNPDLLKFFSAPKQISCASDPNWVFIDKKRRPQLIDSRKAAECTYQSIEFGVSDDKVKLGPITKLPIGEGSPSEMMNVKCTLNKKSWEYPLLTVKKVAKKEEAKEGKQQWNVLMVSFDSISQMTFRRKLPETVKYLEEKLGSIVLNGYNIVGDGTPQAFIPILTGATEEELPLTRKRFGKSSYVDDVYPFIWRNFSDAGYTTGFNEDQKYLGMFNYRLKGFRKPPTDHYARPYFNQLEGRTGGTNAQCVGSDLQHKHWLRYIREYAETYRDTPYFGLFHHCVYSHDDINLVGIIDDDLTAFLTSLSENGLLERTILIVMADHGHRFAALRETHQGQLEERLPFFSMALPKALRDTNEGKKMLENLRTNKDRLSSPFDIHQTLHDIIETPADLTTEQSASSSRSLSLFRPIPSSRSCTEAGIEPHWCTCLDWTDAMQTDQDKNLSTRIAESIVTAFNEQLKDEFKICSPLKLKGIEYAKKLIPKANLLKYKNVKDQDGFVADLSGKTLASFAHYQIKLATSPGRGVYEVTVLYDFKSRHLTLDLSSVSHISAYGNDPHCIIDRNYFLATFCVCYDKI